MAAKTILVAEDDTVLRDVLLEKLRKSGYEAIGAEDGEVALGKMREQKPSLLLLDILMPKKDGMELMEDMNADPSLSEIPIIIISNSGQPVEIEQAKRLGAQDFLIKAVFDPSEVLEKVNTAIGGGNTQGATVAPNADGAENAPEEGETSTDSSSEAPAEEAEEAESSDDIKILVVEDDKFLRELFVRKLFAEGFDVENSIDAQEAFASLENRRPDIILLDLILPGMDGFEILGKLKEDDSPHKDIPVLVLSNLGQQEDIDRAMKLGAKDFLVKANFTLDEIIEHVKEIIKKGL